LTELDPIKQMAQKFAARELERQRRDPRGFYEMSERDLIDWMAEGHAQPGSIVYNQAEHVLSMKQREAAQEDLSHGRMMAFADEFIEGLKGPPAPDPAPDSVQSDRLTETHVAILALAGFVFSLVWQGTDSVLLGMVGFVDTIALLAWRPVRAVLVRLLGRGVG
jgi:hypothetical protein